MKRIVFLFLFSALIISQGLISFTQTVLAHSLDIQSVQDTDKLVLESVYPSVTITNLNEGQNIELPFMVSLSFRGAPGTCAYQIDDGPVQAFDCDNQAFSLNTANTHGPGRYLLTVYVWDNSNRTSSSSASFNVNSANTPAEPRD